MSRTASRGAAARRREAHRGRGIGVLACAAAVLAVLSMLAIGVGGALSPSVVVVPGTRSADAQHLAEARFGPSQLMPILLQGPSVSLERQGPLLVKALGKRPRTRVLSPWNAPAGTEGLRPSRRAAMVLVAVDRPEQKVIESDLPSIEALLRRHVVAPVEAHLTGQPSIDAAMREQALSSARQDGLIAAGVLFLLLLAGLRAPLPALLVELAAGASAISALGLLRLLGEAVAIDPLAVPLTAMTGLALGAGWSLIVLRGHRGQTRMKGGVLLAGSGLVLALLVTSAIAPTKLLVSLGSGVVLSALTALAVSLIVLPAALSLLGRRAISSPAMPAPLAAISARLRRGGAAARRHGAFSALIATLALVLIAVPALAINAGQPGVYQLPEGDQARLAFERVAAVMGPGWPTPYDLVLSNPSGPLTTSSMLAAIDGLQAQIARAPSTASVSGPGALSAQTKPLGKLPGALKESGKLLSGGKRDLQRLQSGLGQAGAGALELQGGLRTAAGGAGELHSGSGRAEGGAQQLHAGLGTARDGSAQLESGLQEALKGANALKSGATEALAGSVDLVDGVSSVRTPVTSSVPSTERLKSLTSQTNAAIGELQGQAQGAGGDLQSALSALGSMSTGKSDPRYQEALAAVQSASGAVGALSAKLGEAAPGAGEAAQSAATIALQTSFLDAALKQLGAGATQLQEGLAKLRAGNAQLADGIERLATGGGQLTAGLTRLQDGAAELQAGLGLLTGGSGELQEGLEGGVSPVGELVTGLGLLREGVTRFSGQLPSPKDLEELQRSSPNLFESGYFLLAAVAGAPPQASNAASFTVNLQRGGNGAEIVVVSKYPAGDPRTVALGEDVARQAGRFARSMRLSAAVGGPAGNLSDLSSAVKERLPWVIAGVAAATLLLLGLALRAVLAPLLAVLLQLLVLASAFGVLTLMLGVSAPPLGGPGHIDYVTIVGVFAIGFGVALLTQALPLALARSRMAKGAEPGRAAQQALRRSATSSAAAAALILAALVPFATSDLIALREVAVGTALAVALSALLVGPLLLPAGLKALGGAGWWPGCAVLRRKDRGGATIGDGQPSTMGGGEMEPRVGIVHWVLRASRRREKE